VTANRIEVHFIMALFSNFVAFGEKKLITLVSR
jgi:hypothetical protein